MPISDDSVGGAKLDANGTADDLRNGGVNGRAEFAFEPRHVERVGDRDTDHARTSVVGQTSRGAEIRVEVSLARTEL